MESGQQEFARGLPELLALSPTELDELVAARSADRSARFEFCRALAAKLRRERVRRNWRAADLARASGVDVRSLRLIERGVLDDSWIADETLDALAEALDIDRGELAFLPEGSDAGRTRSLLGFVVRVAKEHLVYPGDAHGGAFRPAFVNVSGTAGREDAPPGIAVSRETGYLHIDVGPRRELGGRRIVVCRSDSEPQSEIARTTLDADGSGTLVVSEQLDSLAIYVE